MKSLTYVAIRLASGETIWGQLFPRPGLSLPETVEAALPGATLLYSGPSAIDASETAEQAAPAAPAGQL
jgi:hypothetical protein